MRVIPRSLRSRSRCKRHLAEPRTRKTRRACRSLRRPCVPCPRKFCGFPERCSGPIETHGNEKARSTSSGLFTLWGCAELLQRVVRSRLCHLNGGGRVGRRGLAQRRPTMCNARCTRHSSLAPISLLLDLLQPISASSDRLRPKELFDEDLATIS